MIALKLSQIGNSLGVVLPKEALARLRIEKGDQLYLTETPDGYRITPYHPDFAVQMTEAEAVMAENRDVLRALAK